MIYKSIIAKFFVFFIVLIILDYACGSVLEYFFYKQKTGADYQLTYSTTSTNQDLLVFGSSRAQSHYNTTVISKRLGLTCYNAGLNGGYSIFLPNFLTYQTLKRYKPKAIIVEFSPYTLGYWKGDYDRMNIFAPYISKYPEAKKLVTLRDKFEQYKLLSKTYRFNSKIYNIILYNLFEKKFEKVKGFMPIDNEKLKVNTCEENPFSQYKEVDTIKVKMLKNIIELCKENKIKLIFVNSPFYHTKALEPSGAYLQAISIIKDNSLDFIDMSNDKYFMSKPGLFANQLHLNSRGADLFSEMLSIKLKTTIKINQN